MLPPFYLMLEPHDPPSFVSRQILLILVAVIELILLVDVQSAGSHDFLYSWDGGTLIMSLEILFWFLYIICLIFGLWREYVPGQPYPFVRGTWNVLLFVLMGILGWQVFGAPVHR